MYRNQRRHDHAKTEDKYRKYREIAFDVTMEEFSEIQVSGITYPDALEADRWKDIPRSNGRSHRAMWEWAEEYTYYQNRPKRFEVTLKRGGVLCGICYGGLSKHGKNMRMNLIESTPIRPTPLGLKALPIISFAAAAFADIVGAKELWVMDPKPALENEYMKQGFGEREYYHGRRVGQRRIL